MNKEIKNADIEKITVDYATKVRETEEEFIFQTIAPFCCGVLQRKISKKELKEKLVRAERMKWIPCNERLPEDESYILVSFENSTMPDIARYEENDEGGTFYPGDDEKSYSSYGLFVNAWMSLPEPYREEE